MKLSPEQVDALLYGMSDIKPVADKAIVAIEAAFDTRLDVEWCGWCACYRRINSHIHIQTRHIDES